MKENLQRTSGAIDKIPIFPSFLSNISYLSLPLSVFIFTAPEKHTFVFIYYLSVSFIIYTLITNFT